MSFQPRMADTVGPVDKQVSEV